MTTRTIHAVQTLPLLAAGYTTTVTVAWTLPATATLPHLLAAVADPAGQVVETDEANNRATVGVNLPNLSVDAFYTTLLDGHLTAIARLRNMGSGAALTPFTVTREPVMRTTGALLAETAASALDAGGTVTLTFQLTDTTGLAGMDALWVLADAADVVAESSETDSAAVAAGRAATRPGAERRRPCHRRNDNDHGAQPRPAGGYERAGHGGRRRAGWRVVYSGIVATIPAAGSAPS